MTAVNNYIYIYCLATFARELWYVSLIRWYCPSSCTGSSHCLQNIYMLFLLPFHVVSITDIPLCLYKILIIAVPGDFLLSWELCFEIFLIY